MQVVRLSDVNRRRHRGVNVFSHFLLLQLRSSDTIASAISPEMVKRIAQHDLGKGNVVASVVVSSSY